MKMGLFDDAKRFAQRMKLDQNKFRGKGSEDVSMMRAGLAGYEVQKTGRGSDYRKRKVNPFTGEKGPWIYVEVKSSESAPLSKLQKQTQKKKKGRFEVERHKRIF